MRAWVVFIFAVVAASSSVLLGAGPQVSRVLRTIDFEERRLGNAEDLPMHWSKVTGADLPLYVNGALTRDRAHGGEYSFRMDLDGGSVIYQYDPKQIKVTRGAHYLVEAFVVTTPMPNARAVLSAYFLDGDKKIVAGTVRQSTPYAATREDEPWQKVTVELTADDSKSAYLVVEMGVLQPNRYLADAASRSLLPQDIEGTAWFDDIVISQVPELELSTSKPGNIFRRGEPIRLEVTVNDRFTDDLMPQLVVRDAAGASVYQRSSKLDESEASPQQNDGQKHLSLELPGDLAAGWYEASLVMRSGGGVLAGEKLLDFVLLGDSLAATTRPDDRFGVIATALPQEGWKELPEILPCLGAGRVKLAVWSAAGDVETNPAVGFDALLEKLAERGITPTACLVDLPPGVAKRVGSNTWPALLNAKKEDWEEQLAILVSRHANHLDRWQLGADGSDAFVTQPGMWKVYLLLYDEFAKLVAKPDLAMPWPAWCEMPQNEMPATVALSIPPTVLPGQVPLYMQDVGEGSGFKAQGSEKKNHDGDVFSSPRGPMLSLSLRVLDRAQYGRDVQVRDLAQRVVYALSAGAQRIDLPLPFSVRMENGRMVRQPDELLLTMRTLITTLSGATFRGKVPVAEGVEAFLFDRNGTGILCLWDKGHESGVKQLELNPGAHPMMVDLWGNATPLLSSTQARRDGKVQLAIGPTPVFLVDIDGELAQLRSSVAFDRPLLESSFHPHTRHLRFVNPYRDAISGTIRLRAPAGWSIEPPSVSFNLNPGETFDREVEISFPYNSIGGNKSIAAEFSLPANRNSTFVVPLTLKLGLADVGMQTVAQREGKDVLVQQVISNYGDRAIDYSAFAIVPGQARQERLVVNLGAGQTIVKRYRFNNVDPDTPMVRVGLKEQAGTRLLNDQVPIQ